MSNVVSLASRRKKPIPVETAGLPQPVQDMIYELYTWAHANDIDTESVTFKWELATIMAVLQGMLHKNV